MKFEKFNEVAELVGIVAIVASLVFVGLQLRQDHVFARSDLGAGSFESLASLRQEMTGSEFAATYAKMLEQPEQLTTAEQLQVNAYLDAAKFLIIRECYLYERGIFTECNIAVREYGPYFLAIAMHSPGGGSSHHKNCHFCPAGLMTKLPVSIQNAI